MSIAEKQAEIVEEFSMFDDWMQRYEYMIELGKSLPKIEDQYKTDDHLIKGCQSKVWVHAELQDGKLVFTADSDAIITKGIVSLLIRLLSGREPRLSNSWKGCGRTGSSCSGSIFLDCWNEFRRRIKKATAVFRR